MLPRKWLSPLGSQETLLYGMLTVTLMVSPCAAVLTFAVALLTLIVGVLALDIP